MACSGLRSFDAVGTGGTITFGRFLSSSCGCDSRRFLEVCCGFRDDDIAGYAPDRDRDREEYARRTF